MRIKDIAELITNSVTPIPEVRYYLYSLPSFDDNQTREELLGSEIQSNKYNVPDRCILFNKLNVRFKRVWRIDNKDINKICSTEFLPLVIDESKVDYDYCYYLLISEQITNYLCGQNANTSGSHKRIDPKDFLNIELSALPSLDEQKRIGRFLSSIDRKILLNRAINQNLEAIAKQLYDYWFVQFDFPDENGKPYKSSGGKMVWNEKLKRKIPEEWQVERLDSLGTFKNGINYSKDGIGDADYKIVNVRNISSSSLFIDTQTLDNICLKHETADNYLANTNDILIARSGTPGATRILQKGIASIIYCGFIICFSLNRKDMKPLLTYHLKDLELVTKEQSNGSILSNISQDILKDIYAICPSYNVLLAFNQKILPIWDMLDKMLNETSELIKWRDELLPLLMNGQVSVNSDLADSKNSHKYLRLS